MLILRIAQLHEKYFSCFLITYFYPCGGFAIVGGEFELIHIAGNRYQLNLIIYFDELNGSEGAKTQVEIHPEPRFTENVTIIAGARLQHVQFTLSVRSSFEILSLRVKKLTIK